MTNTSFSTRTVPWMTVGTVIDDPSVDAAEAAKRGGIDFTVSMRRAAFERAGGEAWRVAAQRFALVRDDTEIPFDFVSATYKPVQYAEAFSFMDEINPTYVAAGSFNGGRQGFMVAQLPDHMRVDPEPNGESDPHDLYVVLRTSHDRSKALEVAVLPLRNRCMNQLVLPSFARDAPQRWSIRHTGDPHAKLIDAQRTITRTDKYAEVYANTVRQLASVRVTTDHFQVLLRHILPDRPRRDEQVGAITTAFRSSEFVGFPHTGWAAVNAVSEYFEHGRASGSRTAQARFTGGLAGDAAKYVRRVAHLLLAEAA